MEPAKIQQAMESGNSSLPERDKLVIQRYDEFRRSTMSGTKTQDQFNAAVNLIRGLPKDGPFQPSNDMKLRLYGFFKQATEGPCRQPAPSFWDVVGKAKWGAWKSNGDMSVQQAMVSYVDEIKQVMETMSLTEDMTHLMDTLGPVYEYVEEARVSRPSQKHVRFSADQEPTSGGSGTDQPVATNGHGTDLPAAAGSHMSSVQMADTSAVPPDGAAPQTGDATTNGVGARTVSSRQASSSDGAAAATPGTALNVPGGRTVSSRQAPSSDGAAAATPGTALNGPGGRTPSSRQAPSSDGAAAATPGTALNGPGGRTVSSRQAPSSDGAAAATPGTALNGPGGRTVSSRQAPSSDGAAAATPDTALNGPGGRTVSSRQAPSSDGAAAATSGTALNGPGGRTVSSRQAPPSDGAAAATSDTDDDDEFKDPMTEMGIPPSGDVTQRHLDALQGQMAAFSQLLESTGAQMLSERLQSACGEAADAAPQHSAAPSDDAVHQQLKVLVRTLQTDVDALDHRVHSLELTAGRGRVKAQPWWQVPELCPRSLLLLLAWPLLLQLTLSLLRARRRR